MSDSLWKKEISFRRKPKESEPEPELAGEPPAESASIWKREISFRRREKNGPALEATVVQSPGPAEAAPEAKPSIWKKELSLGRKARPEAAHDAEPTRSPSAAVPPPTASELPEPVAFLPKPQPLPDPERRTVEPTASIGAPSEAAVPSPKPETPVAVPAPVEQPLPPAPPTVAAPEPETAAIVAATTPPPAPPFEPAPIAPLHTRAAPAAAEKPVASTPQEPVLPAAVRPAAPHPEVVEPIVASAPAPPELVQSPVIVHPPVSAADLHPLPGPDKVRFWKKELGRKPKRSQASPSSAIPAVAAAVPVASAAKVPFWKKELGRKSRPVAESAPARAAKTAASPMDAPAGNTAPFWKKELGAGRKRKQTHANQADPANSAGAPAKTPFWKLERGGSKGPPRAPRQLRLRRGHGRADTTRLVGLKIGASQLAAARVSNNGAAELQQLAREPLAQGIVVGGELRDPDALAEALKDFFQKHKLPKRGVRLGIANNRIGVRTFDIGGIDDAKQLSNAIRFRAQETLPIPIEEAVLDYHVLGENVDAEGQRTRRVLLVVAYRELVDRYVSACRKAGITLAGIDLEAFALLRALQAPQDGAGSDASAALVAVSIGHERSTFAVSDGRACEFTRVLEWGGAALNIAIARALDRTPSEVVAFKHALSLVGGEPGPEGLTPEQAEQAREAVRRQVQAFARELVASLQFYQSQPNSLGIAEIVITGGTAHLPGLVEELQRLIGVHVRIGDPLARLKLPKKFSDPDQVGSLAIAIGLGIED